MKIGKNKTSFKRLFGMRLFLVVNIILLFVLTLSFGREYLRNRQIQGEINRLQEEAQNIEARNLEVLELNKTFSSKLFLEKEAREKLGLRKSGEKLVIVKDEEVTEIVDGEQVPVLNSAETDLIVPSNKKLWWNYFFNKQEFDKYKEL